MPVKEFLYNYNFIHEEYNYGRMHFCKQCCKDISLKIMRKYWKVETNRTDKISYALGIRAICSFFHMPYVEKVMSKVRDEEINATRDKEWSYVYQYSRALAELEIPHEYWNDLSGNSFLATDLLKVASPTGEGDRDLFDGLQKDWGADYDRLEDYLSLEESYTKYSQGEQFTTAMENTVRRLCMAELDYRKARESKMSPKDLADIEKKISNYYKTLKLDNFQFSENKSIGERSLEKWTSIEENTRPLEVKDKLFAKDICDIGKDYDQILRSIGNLALGKKEYPSLTMDDVKEEE
jgi:hypothetical protein